MKLLCDLFGQLYESSGILRMDLLPGYLSEDGIRDSLRLFFIHGYIFQSDRRLVFGILNYRSSLLCSGLSRFFLSTVFWLIPRATLSMQYSGNSIAELRCLCSDYCSVNLRALPIVLHILIGIDSALVLLVFNLPLNEIARTQFFVRWMDCNTPLPEYVLSCVFRFFDRIFRFTPCICLVL